MLPPHLRPYLVQASLPLALSACLFNIGWTHVFLAFPLAIHLALFVRVANASRDVLDRSPLLGLLQDVNIAALYAVHIFLPDSPDTPDSLRCVFGLVSDRTLVARSGNWACWAAIFSAAGLPLQAMWVGWLHAQDRRPPRVRPPFILPSNTPPIRPVSTGTTWHWP